MNVLHLEDNDDDAELVQALLVQEWPDVRIDRLWTRGEYEAALQLESYDVILSDHAMPGFDGMTALEIAHSCSPDTPFIFLSGTLGEERAIQALKRGAVDYVLKDAPARFISAVRGALADAEREVARRRAEDSLRRNREQFRRIADSIDNFIVLLDSDGRCLYSNPAFLRLLEQDEIQPEFRIFETIHPQDRREFRALFDGAFHQTASLDMKYRLKLPDGSVRYVEACASHPSHRNDEEPTLLLAGRDNTERLHAEEQLREQASLLEKARDAIWLMDIQFTVTEWNASAERIYGFRAAEAVGRDVRELLFSRQIGQFNTAVALAMAKGDWQGEFRYHRHDGSDLVVDSSWSLVNDATGRPKSILCIDTDVTRRKQLELELQRAQRIEGLGMLAGGIAHDLNNVLSPILMSIGLLRPLAVEPDDQMILDTLEASAIHGTDLVQQILLFARGGGGQRAEVHMGRLLGSLEPFLKTVLRNKVELSVAHAQNLWAALADSTQIKQVVVNLCVNARDAMPNGGRIRVVAQNITVPPSSYHGFHGEIPSGRYVRCSVTDTGSGIPPELVEKIFDPFFTTKEIGKGTGLGLSTIAGIMQNHEGAIQVESRLSHGTTFHIYLPAIAVSAESRRPAAAGTLAKGNGETILVIDDDEATRQLAEKILTTYGYRALTAADGPSGLKIFHEAPDAIQVVICDQIMPGLSGSDVLEELGRISPDVRMILMGQLVQDTSAQALADGRRIVRLPKPLTPEKLLRTIREVIDRKNSQQQLSC